VYAGARHLGADFILGGSGHNAGIVNPPSANKHGYWTNGEQPENAHEWLESAVRHDGSWWPWWTNWLDTHGSGKAVGAREAKNPIEPAPGRYAMMP
jgi:polyhydroxyalkanoate synthase